MRAVVQRVSHASVSVLGELRAEIGPGLLVLLGLRQGDTSADLDYVVQKIANLRIFQDSAGKMNLSVRDVGGSICVVSQFTLYGDTRKGNRPSFVTAMEVEQARAMWPDVERAFTTTGINCVFGEFQAEMVVELANQGPVTVLVDSSS